MNFFWVSEHLANLTVCGHYKATFKKEDGFYFTEPLFPYQGVRFHIGKKLWEQNGISIQAEVEEPTDYSFIWK